jgi:tetratricopeptide (TPR) repeat protein
LGHLRGDIEFPRLNLNMKWRLSNSSLVLMCVPAIALGAVSAQTQPTAVKPVLTPAKITDERIRFFQAQLARDPDYYVNYNRLASAYTQKARESGDISYYELAEKALKKSLEMESEDPEAAGAFAQLGGVQFAEHRFSEAAAAAEHALKLEENDPSARALAGDAQLEMGNYSEASTIFGKLVPADETRPHHELDYLSLTRRASLAWIHGEVAQSISLMRQAVTQAELAHLPAENISWTHFILGEQLFQSGDLPAAEAAMKASLTAYPSYHRALAGMGQVRAAQLRFDEATGFYKQALNIIPLPIYAAALGDIYRRVNNNSDAEKQYALVEYIGRLGTLNRQVYNRELALFYADHDRHLDDALRLAQRELDVRHDIYTWDALAWALLKNNRAREAHEAMHKAFALGTRDPLLLFHAAAVEHAIGDTQRSGEYAREAITINPEFHVLYAAQAREWLPQGTQADVVRGSDVTH